MQRGECLDFSIERALYTEMRMSRLLYRGGLYTQRRMSRLLYRGGLIHRDENVLTSL